MTVKELIDLLKEMPLSADVTVMATNTGVEIEIEEILEYSPHEVAFLGREIEKLDM